MFGSAGAFQIAITDFLFACFTLVHGAEVTYSDTALTKVLNFLKYVEV